MTRTCKTCGTEKPLEEFPVADKRGYRRRQCRECNNEYQRALYLAKCGERKGKNSMAAVDIRQRVFSHYGGKCAGCGEPDWVVLTIDHINEDGGDRRRKGEPKGIAFYRWIENNNYPTDLQLLCRNCNWRKYVGKVQRLSRKGVGPSGPKRPAPPQGG